MVSYLINPDTPIHLKYKPVTKVLVEKKTYLNNIKLNVHTYHTSTLITQVHGSYKYMDHTSTLIIQVH